MQFEVCVCSLKCPCEGNRISGLHTHTHTHTYTHALKEGEGEKYAFILSDLILLCFAGDSRQTVCLTLSLLWCVNPICEVVSKSIIRNKKDIRHSSRICLFLIYNLESSLSASTFCFYCQKYYRASGGTTLCSAGWEEVLCLQVDTWLNKRAIV